MEALTAAYYKDAYEVYLSSEEHPVSFEGFGKIMDTRTGFVLQRNGKTIGTITFSDYVPGCNIVIHFSIDKAYHKRWVTRTILKEAFGYVFNTLELPRVSTYVIIDKSKDADTGKLLSKLGFKIEGIMRKSIRLYDGLHDLILYGLLKEECICLQW